MISILELFANLQSSGITISKSPGKLIGIGNLDQLRKNKIKGRLSNTGAKLAGMKGNLGPKITGIDLRKKEINTAAIKTLPDEKRWEWDCMSHSHYRRKIDTSKFHHKDFLMLVLIKLNWYRYVNSFFQYKLWPPF